MLTRREREVVDLVCRGAANKEIAYRLGIAIDTVKLHVRHALAKTGARNRTQLAMMMVKEEQMPPRSEAQRKAMQAAAHGKSTLGIPKKVAREYVAADKGGKLPARKSVKRVK